MTSYGFPQGHRYSRSDYWPFRGVDASTASRCGGVAGGAFPESGALGPKGTVAGRGPTIVSITDGTSNTLLFTEFAGRGLNIYLRGQSVAAIGSTAPSPLPAVSGVDMYVRGSWCDQNGTPRLFGYSGATIAALTTASGCEMINVTNHQSPYSFHTGGVNALRCDGSTSFVRSSIASATMIAMVTKSGGEVFADN
jgi:prepilin-type processing-associated H-X9-DG protein